jgi:hypothetical protein
MLDVQPGHWAPVEQWVGSALKAALAGNCLIDAFGGLTASHGRAHRQGRCASLRDSLRPPWTASLMEIAEALVQSRRL